MILEFEVENYRSIKDKQVFSMVAESSKSKPDNVFEHQLASGETVRLLKAAVVYGANASGKSNLLKAFKTLRNFIQAKLSINDAIEFFDPFLFDVKSVNEPTRFVLTFIGENNHKFKYEISYNNEEVFEERLDFYPKGKVQNLFKRPISKTTKDTIHIVKLGQIKNNKTLKVFKNQLVLSKFGFDTPDEFFSPIYQYFDNDNFSILNPELEKDLKRFRNTIANHLVANPKLLSYLSRLMEVSDTKIDDIKIKEYSGNVKSKSDRIKRYDTFGVHPIFDKKERIGTTPLTFEQQSKGSNILFSLGGLMLYMLKLGGVFIIDEIDTSLHPKLAKFLIQLYQNAISNPKNAQIIFTTHETAFLDKDLFRKDQIWFTEKNEYGETELFSTQDFDKVREDTPFDKWYMAGKFGGIPDIQALEAIFSNGKTK